MTYSEASDRRKVTGPIRSLGAPILPCGISEVHFSLRSGLSSRIFCVLFRKSAFVQPHHSRYQDFLQSSKHVSRRDAVHPDASLRPLNSQRRGEMSDSCLGGVIRCLGLRDVDDRTAHASDEDHAALALPLHEVPGNGGSEKICSVDVDAPELAHPVDGVVDGLEVLGEAGRGDEVVDLAVLGQDLGYAGVDRGWVRDVGVVGCYFGKPR